jgi:streptogramin lyase
MSPHCRCRRRGSRVGDPADAARSTGRAVATSPTVTITQFDDLLPSQGLLSPYAAYCLAAGPNNALWILEDIDQDSGPPAVTEVATSGTRVRSFHCAESSSPSAYDIVAGPDGALWFADVDTGGIRRLAPSGGFTKYPVGGAPVALAFGNDGGLWFTLFPDQGGDAIGRLS